MNALVDQGTVPVVLTVLTRRQHASPLTDHPACRQSPAGPLCFRPWLEDLASDSRPDLLTCFVQAYALGWDIIRSFCSPFLSFNFDVNSCHGIWRFAWLDPRSIAHVQIVGRTWEEGLRKGVQDLGAQVWLPILADVLFSSEAWYRGI